MKPIHTPTTWVHLFLIISRPKGKAESYRMSTHILMLESRSSGMKLYESLATFPKKKKKHSHRK